MKVFIQSLETAYFLRADGSWTAQLDSAADFISLPNGLDACRARKLEKYQFVLRFKDPQGDLPLNAPAGFADHFSLWSNN